MKETLRQKLERCRTDLKLSYQCLALEQAAAREAEHALKIAEAELSSARAWNEHYLELLRRLERHFVDREKLFKAALKDELDEQSLLRGRLEASHSRIRELEELLKPADPRPVIGLPRYTHARIWVDGWAAGCYSLS